MHTWYFVPGDYYLHELSHYCPRRRWHRPACNSGSLGWYWPNPSFALKRMCKQTGAKSGFQVEFNSVSGLSPWKSPSLPCDYFHLSSLHVDVTNLHVHERDQMGMNISYYFIYLIFLSSTFKKDYMGITHLPIFCLHLCGGGERDNPSQLSVQVPPLLGLCCHLGLCS